MHEPSGIKGNQLTLIGVLWYLPEFAAIILFLREMPPAGSSAADYAAYYADNQANLPLYVVGVCTAILGRLAFASALRNAFRPFEDLLALLRSRALPPGSAGSVSLAASCICFQSTQDFILPT